MDEEVFSKTDSALGHFMTRHNLYAQGMHGATPSRTSRWYSVNLGQLHLVGLDLGQGGGGVGPAANQTNPFWEQLQTEQVSQSAARPILPFLRCSFLFRCITG